MMGLMEQCGGSGGGGGGLCVYRYTQEKYPATHYKFSFVYITALITSLG